MPFSAVFSLIRKSQIFYFQLFPCRWKHVICKTFGTKVFGQFFRINYLGFLLKNVAIHPRKPEEEIAQNVQVLYKQKHASKHYRTLRIGRLPEKRPENECCRRFTAEARQEPLQFVESDVFLVETEWLDDPFCNRREDESLDPQDNDHRYRADAIKHAFSDPVFRAIQNLVLIYQHFIESGGYEKRYAYHTEYDEAR